MPTVGTLTVPGNSGNEYKFDLYSRYANLPDGAGVYIFTKEVGDKHTILYVGQTESFEDRPVSSGHEKWNCVVRNGLTHIGLYIENSEHTRRSIERELINKYDPVCNG